MKVVCISDTHGMEAKVPDGDVLIHAGDLTIYGKPKEFERVGTWLRSLPHPVKIIIAGNHDIGLDPTRVSIEDRLTNQIALTGYDQDVYYLDDVGLFVDGLFVYGSPWQPEFHDWAFNLPRGDALRRVWQGIPDGLDILITHGPPAGILDEARGVHVGCEDLRAIVELRQPKLHVFGHIHEGYRLMKTEHTTYVNASICNFLYDPVNAPIVVDL